MTPHTRAHAHTHARKVDNILVLLKSSRDSSRTKTNFGELGCRQPLVACCNNPNPVRVTADIGEPGGRQFVVNEDGTISCAAPKGNHLVLGLRKED